MRILTEQQARILDKRAQQKYGMPVLLLMENAGRQVAFEAAKSLKNKSAKIAVFCGKGNNGGDGFVAARHLLCLGFKPDIFLAEKISRIEHEARLNLNILLKLKTAIKATNGQNLKFVTKGIAKYDLIIDALLGIGLKGEVRGFYRKAIGAINDSKAYVLSVDIPSGLDATTGRVMGACVRADKTVTFTAKKRGMIYGEGRERCGKIVVADLGIII